MIEKALMDRTNRMGPPACKKVEDENDDEVEDIGRAEDEHEEESPISEFRFSLYQGEEAY